MNSIEEFKKSELNGLSSFNVESEYDCPNCSGSLIFETSEASNYDVEAHGLYMRLSCNRCSYYVQVTGAIDYVQRKDENENWLNPDDDGYDDLYDVWEWYEWSLYYDDELNAVCYEITDSKDRSIRYVCEDPEFKENKPEMVDSNELLTTFKTDLKGQFPMLPEAIINWYSSTYEYLLDKLDDYMDRLADGEKSGENYIYFGIANGIYIKWDKLSYESGECPDYYCLQEIVDEDVDDSDFPPLTEEEKQLFHKMEHDIIKWLNTNFDEISLYE